MNAFRLLKLQNIIRHNLKRCVILNQPNRYFKQSATCLDTKPKGGEHEEYPPPPPSTTVTQPRKLNLLDAKKFLDTILFFLIAFAGYQYYKKSKATKKEVSDLSLEYLEETGFKNKLFKTNLAPSYILPDFVQKNVLKIKSFELRNSDIFIASFPKSGTTWVQEIVYLIVNNCDFSKAKSASIEDRMPFLDYPNPGVNAINKRTDSPRIIKTHLPKPYLPDDIEKKCKVIYIVRNPKDVTVSYYNFIKMSTQAEYKGNFKEFFRAFVTGVVPYGPWWNHIDDFLSTPNVHILSYEDLHTKPIETIKDLCKFLGREVSDDNIKKIVEWCSYKNMKENKSVNYEWYKDYGLFKKEGSFFRKGEIGDWLNWFSKDMSLILDKTVENKLKTKYNFNYGIPSEDLDKAYKHYDENKPPTK